MAFDFPAQTNKNYLQTINPNAPDAGAALKVLSLNLPNFLGGSPIAPDGLLRPGLSTNAQVGGTATPPPVAAPSAALAGLSAQLGSPDQTPSDGGPPLAGALSASSPTAQSPFASSTAPIAGLASSIVGSTPGPSQPSPGTPRIDYGQVPGRDTPQPFAPASVTPTGPGGDAYGGASSTDPLLAWITQLLQGGGGAGPSNNSGGAAQI